MSKSQDHMNHLSREQIRSYLNGDLNDMQMHQIEKHLLECDLCQDAMDGFEQVDGELIDFDMTELQSKLYERVHQKKGKKLWPYYSAAASVVIVVAAFVFLYQNDLTTKEKAEQIALESSEKELEPIQEEVIATPDPKEESEGVEEKAIAQAKPVETKKTPVAEKAKKAVSTAQPIERRWQESVAPPVKKDDQLVVLNEVEKELVLETELAGNDGVAGDAELAPAPIPQLTKTQYMADEDLAAVEEEVVFDNVSKDEAVATARGTVLSLDDGEPIVGVSVVIKGTSLGTTTDIEGRFEVEMPTDSAVLVFSFLGMESTERSFSSNQYKDVVLNSDAAELSEVVVTAYGQSRSKQQITTTKPSPFIGKRQYKAYVKSNLTYPTEAVQNNIEGKVKVEFLVSESRELLDFRIKKSLGFGCDEEAIRLLKEGPEWISGTREGIPVSMTATYTINFKLPK